MTKEGFRERFSDDPRKDDLTVLAPKQDDPTEQVRHACRHMHAHSTCHVIVHHAVAACRSMRANPAQGA